MNKSQSAENFDVIIIGGGASGMSAGLWCDELGLNALLLEENESVGGQFLWTYNPIKNYLGVEAANGLEMRDIFLKQINERKFTVKLSCKVAAINVETKSVLLNNGKIFSAKTIIYAAGVSRRKLNIEGEESLRNRGIIESGKRDQHLVKGKKAAVIGGGDAAFENALILAESAAEVFLINRHEYFRARSEFTEQVKQNPKITILTNNIVQEIIGKEKVEGIQLKNVQTDEMHVLQVEAVVIRLGVEPNTKPVDGKLDLDERGYIKINSCCETNIKGVFAVGDVANPIAPTISSAVGMGATAAKAIFAQLNS